MVVLSFILDVLGWAMPYLAVSVIAMLLFGGRGIAGAFCIEVVYLWISRIFFMPMDTGLEGLALMIGTGYLLVANLILLGVCWVSRRHRP